MRSRSLVVLIMMLAPATVWAEPEIDLMGNWTVRPYTWRTTGCRYHQWVSVERRLAPNRYAGTAHWRHDCLGLRGGESTTPVMLTVEGSRVTVTSDSPSWLTETLEYRSSTRMDGRDTIGHRFIYERRTRPGV